MVAALHHAGTHRADSTAGPAPGPFQPSVVELGLATDQTRHRQKLDQKPFLQPRRKLPVVEVQRVREDP